MELEEYVQARGRALLGLAWLLTGNHHAAEDLTQATLTKALSRWHLVSAAADPDAYIRRICVNLHLSWVRRLASRERPTADRPDEVATSTAEFDAVGHRDELGRALSRLRPRTRAALVLRYYADLDDQAIADLLGVKRATVRSLIHRGLHDLRALVPEGSHES
ncbi:SigE family RNA polymerase sigma factor [Jiangella anatolica]|uniref:SigE family RNA polymerase sigma factor n=1 Tax=Jiangella anatolica TaxID=2670374 RepID=A0A2W2B6I0_9ACTN|nr:SigE family RNA polymerase sigma factor [Jiangella anatolica]PZF81662.1 hypothetical protein C1I92_20070 [Jiangella anatolica]